MNSREIGRANGKTENKVDRLVRMGAKMKYDTHWKAYQPPSFYINYF